jgi:mannose-6-phosphate isomerase-like protein (cupin superfamily)
MADVAVIDAGRVQPRLNPDTGLTVRPTLGTQTGFEPLEQAVLELESGSSNAIAIGPVEETLFVLEGEGAVTVAGEEYALEPEVGLYLPPESTFKLHNRGVSPLRVLAVRVPDPVGTGSGTGRPAVCRLEESELEAATAEREFRIVADPSTGLRSATHFVGYIPPERAPDHFHTYDEVIYVLDGVGVMHAGEINQPLTPGSCIQLPALTVHCLENTGTAPMRVVAVFRPAGSPAEAYYPDGAPAQYSATPQSMAGGWGCSSNQASKGGVK